MSSIGAALILTVVTGAHGYSVSVTPVDDVDDCHALRSAVALTYARSEQYIKKSYPDIWETRSDGVRLENKSGYVKLECTPVK